MELRPYQREAVDAIYSYFENGGKGNPLISAPTASGKSLILAKFCQEVVERWPNQRILITTHVKELLEQNAQKLLQFWPAAPIGIYSAGLKSRQLGRKITVGGIQSIYNKSKELGWVDVVICDECFIGETEILTPSGSKRIDLVSSGDIVHTALGYGVVEAVSAKQAKRLLKVDFSDGTKLICTPNHRIFTNRGWIQAGKLVTGEISFRAKDLCALWEYLSPLVQIKTERVQSSSQRKAMAQARHLLNLLLKEATQSNEQSPDEIKGKSNAKENKAHAHQAWWERAIIALSTVGATSRARRGVGIGGRSADKDGASQSAISKPLQDRHSQQRKNDWNRIRRIFALLIGASSAGRKKNRSSCFPRVVNISDYECKGSRTVFNLQVSGHPSYFANGKLVHNCHLIPSEGEGRYRTLIQGLSAINRNVKLIGLTATPWRSKTGLLTDKGGIFTDIAYEIDIVRLIKEGYLCPLVSKSAVTQADLTEVGKRGGEFIQGEAEIAFDKNELTQAAIDEMETYCGDRKSWMVFCSGVAHANHVAEALNERGHSAKVVVGETEDMFRTAIVNEFKSGQLKCLVNVGVFTTGFDAPNVDALILLRATGSTGLYVQILGRGMRLHSQKTDCMVLDFGGNILRHGALDEIKIKKKRESGDGEKDSVHTAPVKICPQCRLAVPAATTLCGGCGYEFIIEKPIHDVVASFRPVMSLRDKSKDHLPVRLEVSSVLYTRNEGKMGKPPTMRVTYQCSTGSGNLQQRKVMEWVCVEHRNMRDRVCRWWLQMKKEDAEVDIPITVDQAVVRASKDLRRPSAIWVEKDGEWDRIISREFNTPEEMEAIEDLKAAAVERLEKLQEENGILIIYKGEYE